MELTPAETQPTDAAPTRAADVVLIDLSSIAHPIWHMSQANPDANHASQQIVARVRGLANGHAKVAVCVDAGKSFRHDVAASYKANRPESEAPLHHRIRLAAEQFEADGFPVWQAAGFEADDVIATACGLARQRGQTVLIVSADKDLLQLVGDGVEAKSTRDGTVLDAAAVKAKYSVVPAQMRDYLTLVGDAADNIHGARGIGPKTAAALLTTFGTLDAVYTELTAHGTKFKPATATALRELEPRLTTVRTLITLRTDVPVPFEQIDEPRVARVRPEDEFVVDEDEPVESPPDGAGIDTAPPAAVPPPVAEAPSVRTRPTTPEPPAGGSLVVQQGEPLAPPPAEWERQLDPRSMGQAQRLALDLYKSTMFSAYGTPQAVLSTILVGRELGLPAMASLRQIHNIDGKHGLSASLMVALILKSGFAKYFEPLTFSEIEATFETHRIGARHAVMVTHTIEMARQAWPKAKPDWEKRFLDSGYGRYPTDMLVARATARLARLVYPDVLGAFYTPEELREIAEARKDAAA